MTQKTAQELIFQFNEAAKNAHTPGEARDAAAGLPELPPQVIDYIISVFCPGRGIDKNALELTDFLKQTTEYKAEQEEKKAQADAEAVITEYETITKEYRDNEARGALPTKEQRADLSDRFTRAAARVGTTATKSPFITFDQYIESLINKNWWEEFAPMLYNRLPFPDGTLSTIGAAPGGGKSAALVNICRELLTAPPPENPIYEKAQAKNAKRNILFLSAEMTAEAITDRLNQCIAWDMGRDDPRYELKGVKEAWDYERRVKDAYKGSGELIAHNEKEAARAELYKEIHDEYIRPAWGKRLQIAYVRNHQYFDEIINLIKTLAEPGTIVLMDYLQLFKPMKADTEKGGEYCPRYLQIGHIVNEVISAAEQTKSVIICAAQLGRTERQSGSGKQADDTQGWRESGDIEQSSWNLVKMFLEVNEDNPAEKQLSYRVAKARSSGHLGESFVLDWTPKYQHMEKTSQPKPKMTPWAQRAAEEKSRKKGEQLIKKSGVLDERRGFPK